MPILELEIIGAAEDYDSDLAQTVADSAAAALKSRPQGTWVKLCFTETNRYAENGGAVDEPPIIVNVLQAEVPNGAELRTQILELTSAISAATRRSPSSVHIIMEPAAKGRIAFGGSLVE